MSSLLQSFTSQFSYFDEDLKKLGALELFKTNVSLLDQLEARIGFAFPDLYRELVLNYQFDAVDLNGYSLLANRNDEKVIGIENEIYKDMSLWPTLLDKGFIQFGKGEKFSDYDPVCFDTNNQSSVVKIDHEAILIYEKIRVVQKLANSFSELVEETVHKAQI